MALHEELDLQISPVPVPTHVWENIAQKVKSSYLSKSTAVLYSSLILLWLIGVMAILSLRQPTQQEEDWNGYRLVAKNQLYEKG